jgi:hypothetical protein
MKTQIIHLAGHDDLVTIRDRMAWAKTPRILLVWPRHGKVALRPVDLTLLQRRAFALGAQLGLVSRSDAIRREAAELGLPVFESLPEAQRQSWPEQPRVSPARRSPRPDLRAMRREAFPPEAAWRSHPLTRILAFSAGVLSVLVLVLGFLPGARITLTVEKRAQAVTIPVSSSPGVRGVYLSGSLPSYEVETSVDGSDSVAVHGVLAIPVARASGVVRFQNLTDRPITIPAGTVVRTAVSPPVRFETVEDVALEPGTKSTIDVSVQALDAGSASNLDAGLIQAVEGDLGLAVSATNPSALAGGTDESVIAPDEDERAALRAGLFAALEKDALDQMALALPQESLVFPDTLEVVGTPDETFTPPAGEPGKTLSLEMRATFRARYAAAADLRQLIGGAMDAALPAGFLPRAGSLVLKVSREPVTATTGVTRWEMSATRELLRSVDERRAVWLSQGRSVKSALARLADLPLAGPPQIALNPSWWPFLPVAPFRIEVDIR